MHFETLWENIFLQLIVDFSEIWLYKSVDMTLAEKLRKLRDRNHLSMVQVARLSEKTEDRRGRITQGYISRLESGKETNPSLLKLITLCRIYHITPNTLIATNSRKKAPNKR